MGNVLSFSNAKEMNGVVKVYSVYGLIGEYQRMHPNGHFFDRDTLKFFGETVSSMRLLKGTVDR